MKDSDLIPCTIRREDFFKIERALHDSPEPGMSVQRAGSIWCDVAMGRATLDKVRSLGFALETKPTLVN